MKCDRLWQESIPARDDVDSLIHCIVFSPNGSQALVASGKRVLVYNANDGVLQHSLKGHKAEVYAISYSFDGNRFASGGAGCNVYVWTNKCEGLFKYSHDSSIQCLAYNPIDNSLASGTGHDFGIWSPTQRSVTKHTLKSKCLCLAWTNDGLHITLGLFNGHVSIRDTSGVEKVLIKRSSPIWCLQWSPPTQQHNSQDELDTLVVGCWDQTLSFYHLSGQQRGSERVIGYDPLGLCWYDNGEYILCGGSDRKVSLYTKSGQFLKVVCETNAWVSTLATTTTNRYFAVGRMESLISLHQTVFNTVHGLYQDRYAYRDTMTEVIIQHLITEQKVRIKVRDYVKKIAVYKDHLAIQLSGRILIYQCESNDANDMHYLLRTKVEQQFDCNLLVVTAENIILCHEKRLQLYDFHGEKVREWSMDSVIRYIRVIGGPIGREGLLVGLKDGKTHKIFVDNHFPIDLIQHSKPIRCLDINASRDRLAVVDEESKLCVYDIPANKIIFEDTNANSVAWNTEMNTSLCYSGRGYLSIKHDEFPVNRQPLQGFVVGFKGSKIFCLHHLSMRTVDVPQSYSMYQYIDNLNFEKAYSVACLGVTREDWTHLAHTSLKNMALDVARKSFIRLRDYTYLQLLDRIEASQLDPEYNKNRALADIYAYQGRFKESALLYVKSGLPKYATEMLFDLGEFEQAKALLNEMQRKESKKKKKQTTKTVVPGNEENEQPMSDLFLRQGQWLHDNGRVEEAAEMYWTAKNYMKCIKILGDNKHVDKLIAKVRALNKSFRQELETAAEYFVTYGEDEYTKETYLKLEDYNSLISAYIKLQHWDDAFELARLRPELAQCIYEPYAESLALQDRFEEAEEAFIKAGKANRAMNLLRSLTSNAILQNRYNDAAYYFWKLAVETMKSITDDERKSVKSIHLWKPWCQHESTNMIHELDGRGGADDDNDVGDVVKSLKEKLMKFQCLYTIGNIYFAYHQVYRFTDQPFTAVPVTHIFHSSHMVLNYILDASSNNSNTNGGKFHTNFINIVRQVTDSHNDLNISNVRCLYAFSEIGQTKGVYKSVRIAYELLRRCRIPNIWKDQLEVNALKVRNKPFTDMRDLQVECFRCGAQTALLANQGNCDECVQCGHAYQRSFANFEVLPLVEFFIDDDIDESEAQVLINRLPSSSSSTSSSHDHQQHEHITDTSQALHFDDDDIGGGDYNNNNNGNDDDGGDSQFMKQLIQEDISYPPIKLNRIGLNQLNPREVFYKKWNHLCNHNDTDTNTFIRTQYYKCIISDFPISQCHQCQRFFHEEEYESYVLQNACCPVCRAPQKHFN